MIKRWQEGCRGRDGTGSGGSVAWMDEVRVKCYGGIPAVEGSQVADGNHDEGADHAESDNRCDEARSAGEGGALWRRGGEELDGGASEA